MENKLKSMNWEKISTYVAGLALVITLWSFLNQSQRDISDIRERVAVLEVQVVHLEKEKKE